MKTKTVVGAALGAILLAIALVQFVPAPPLVIPATLPAEDRAAHRLLNFEGIANFRDLGGSRPVTAGP